MEEGFAQEDGPFQKYQREHQKKLAAQAQRSAEEEAKIKAAARSDIEKFKRERAQKAEKARNDNRIAEKESRSHIEKERDEGNPWERIVQLIDLKAGKTEGKDVSAMRRILVEAKHLPVKSH